MNLQEFDLVILGAGPGGYVGAIAAAQRGLTVALVEGREVGGVCLHAGCIPTKTMVAYADLLRQVRSARDIGAISGNIQTTLASLHAQRKRVVSQLTQGVNLLLDKNGVRLFQGWGCFRDAQTVAVLDSARDKELAVLRSRAMMIATGSHPVDIPGIARNGSTILDSSDALNMSELPEELLILGGGYIGCEFASIYSALGTHVTILEAMSRLLPGMDRELGQALERAFKKAGITVLVNSHVRSVETAGRIRVLLEDGNTLSGDKLLVSVGRVPQVENFGLDQAGVQLNGRAIAVNDFLETNIPGIYAVGDVTGKYPLAHVASAQARYLAGRLALHTHRAEPVDSGLNRQARDLGFTYHSVPACVFTFPEIASVGFTEEEATRTGMTVRISRFPFAASGKALASGDSEGFVKLVADAKTERIVGGQILGTHAAELIGQVALAVHAQLTASQWCDAIVAHPTLSEAIHEAAEGLFGRPIHVFSRSNLAK
jgi:dihydrolipoamide dehydrogenase